MSEKLKTGKYEPGCYFNPPLTCSTGCKLYEWNVSKESEQMQLLENALSVYPEYRDNISSGMLQDLVKYSNGDYKINKEGLKDNNLITIFSRGQDSLENRTKRDLGDYQSLCKHSNAKHH